MASFTKKICDSSVGGVPLAEGMLVSVCMPCFAWRPSLDKKHHDMIDWLVKCRKCGNRFDIEAREEAPVLLCRTCNTIEKVPIFQIEELAYVSSPFFSNIWLPPD